MFERPKSGERAVLIHARVGRAPDPNERDEFVELAISAGAQVVDELSSSRFRPDSRHFIGKGKVEDLKRSIEANKAELVISSAALSPSAILGSSSMIAITTPMVCQSIEKSAASDAV